MTLLQLLPTLLVAAAAIIAPLLAGIPGDEVWTNLCLALGLLAAAIAFGFVARNVGNQSDRYPWAFAAPLFFLIVGAISVLANLHGEHADVMFKGLAYWFGLLCITGSAGWASLNRVSRYAIVLSVIFAATVASAIGVQDYLVTVFRNHIPNWREFGTSTPDYFAAYLLLTIPLTLAVFLGAPSGEGKRASWLYALALVLQLAVLPTTGSRFALVSITVGLVVFVALVLFARKSGTLTLEPSFRKRATTLVGACFVGAVVFAAPLLHRLSAGAMRDQEHSGEFRIWTWRGALKLAEQHILLGAGPGMFTYTYPKVALVSFTRVAHSGYLQFLDEFGLLGLLVLCLILTSVLSRGIRAATHVSASQDLGNEATLQVFAATDDRLLLCGLVAGLLAGFLQNFIDSDWNLTIFAVTLFVLAGVVHGTGTAMLNYPPHQNPAPPRTIRLIAILGAAAALVSCVICLVWTAAAGAAKTGDFAKAVSLDPLDATYHSDYAWKSLIPLGQVSQAESELSRAISLGPDSVFYYRRSELYDQSNRPQLALADIRTGLTLDPNSLELLNRGAEVSEELGDHDGAMSFYRKIADLGAGLYGNVRPITEIVEYRYALADGALGIDAAKTNNPSAMDYLTRAETILETYCDEGGSTNAMRAAEVGEGGPQLDQKLQAVYGSVMTAIVRINQHEGKTAEAAAAQAKALSYYPRFIHDNASIGGTPGAGG